MRPQSIVLLLASLLAVAPVAAQVDEASVSGTATLPQSNEAQLLSGQIQQAIQGGEYAVAFELMTRLPATGEELLVAPGGRTLYPTWRERLRLQELLPPDARANFEERFGALVRGRFDRAKRQHDLAALRQIFVEYRAATLWDSAATELVDRLIDAGRFAAAAQALSVVRSGGAGGRYAIQQIIAMAGAGAPLAAARRLEALRSTSASDENAAGVAASLATLQEWFAERARRSADAAPGRPAWELEGAWSSPLEAHSVTPAHARSSDAALQDAIDRLRRLPQLQVCLTPGELVFRCRGAVYCFDPLPLTMRWVALEELPLGTVEPESPSEEIEGGVSEDAWSLVTNSLRHVCSVANGRVFTVERVQRRDRQPEAFGWQGGGIVESPNLLVARSVEDGRMLWRAGDDPAGPLFGVSFQDGACASGDALYVVFQRRDSAFVAALDARNGRLIRERKVIGPPTVFSSTGGRCQIVSDGDMLFVSTGNGVVAALSVPDLNWLWAATYPSTLAAQRGRRWWDRQRIALPTFGFDAPVIAEDLLLVTPADTDAILAYDRFDGRQRWPMMPRALYRSVVGATRAGVVLLGTSLVCVDPEDGQTIRWRSAQLETQGRPLIGDDGNVYVAVRDGIVAVDGATGKLIAAPRAMTSLSLPTDRSAVGDEPAYLGVALAQDASAMYAVSPNGITKFPRTSGLQEAIRARLASDAGDPAAALASAWADLAAGRVREVIAQAELLKPGGPEQAASRERLLTYGFLALARGATDAAERLEWLRRAVPLTTSENARARLALSIGEALEAAGQHAAAFEHALEQIIRGDAMPLPVPVDRELSITPVLSATAAARRTIEKLPPDEAPAIVQRLIAAHRGQWRALARLRTALPASMRGIVDAALLQSDAPYEWIDVQLALNPTGEQDTDIERMAAAVAVGDLQRARSLADGLQLADPPELPIDDTPREAAEWRRALVGHNYKKLMRGVEQPAAFDKFVACWRATDQTALRDADGGVGAPFGLAYAAGDAQPELRLIEWRTGNPWRKHTAKLKFTDADAALAEAARALQRGDDAHDGPLYGLVSALRRYRSLGVVATRHGLIAIGLAAFGEEPRAGARLWDCDMSADAGGEQIPGWFSTPATHVAVGPTGVAVLRASGAVRLLDWADGSLRWERNMATFEPVQILFCGSRLVAIDGDGAALVLNGEDGTVESGRLPEGARLREPQAVGEALWVRTESIAGLWDLSRGEPIWQKPFEQQSSFQVDAVGGIAVVNLTDGPGWAALNVQTGEPLPLAGLGEASDVLAVARRESLVFAVESRPAEPLPTIAYRAFDADSGALRWTREVQTRAMPSPQLLIGNPTVIPVLVQPGDGDGDAGAGAWTLMMIDKETGRTSTPQRLSVEPPSVDEGIPEATVIATPVNVLIHLGNRLTAWGKSSWGEGP